MPGQFEDFIRRPQKSLGVIRFNVPNLRNGIIGLRTSMDFSGRQIMVTGASSGLGRGASIVLNRLGAKLVLIGRDETRLRKTLGLLEGDGHRAEIFDLSRSAEIVDWFTGIAKAAGPFQGLLHCAGQQMTAPVNVLDAAKIRDLLELNVTSGLMLARAFSQVNCHVKPASIVYVASVMALAGAPALSTYSATKGALVAMVKSLALELAPKKIRVNCLSPGYVHTEMAEQAREVMTEDRFAAIEALHPLGLGTVEDVAQAAAFLLADTSRWITGTNLIVDGGYTAR